METAEKTFDRLRDVVNKLLQVNRAKELKDVPMITLQTDIYSDLGIDSLEVMDLIAAIEKEFCILVVPEDLAGKSKMSDIVQEIQKRMTK